MDLFGKFVDLLFERGVLPHLENPPGYGPVFNYDFMNHNHSTCASYHMCYCM